ncbi:MAG: helix-turn-helix domain-containing protein [Lentisphaeria bacterium]|nr:helix-turn-helix domain-containing protein [Lentisphaeria bacterium]
MAHLTHSQRSLIKSGLKNQDSFKEISRSIGKSPSTVSQEVLKHRIDSDKGTYGRITNRCIYRRNCSRLRVCDELCKTKRPRKGY